MYPMLLRRDTNVNEVDLFSVIYSSAGTPVPTTNLNYVINKNRTVLSKNYIYKLAMKNGNNGLELVPNTLTIINPDAIDPRKRELYSAMYIDRYYDNFDETYKYRNGQIIYNYSDGTHEYGEPDKVKEFVCPFNVVIDKKEGNKVGYFEYIPHTLDHQPTIEDQIDYVDINISLNRTQFSYLPSTAIIANGVSPTHLNVLSELTIENNMDPSLVRSYVKLVPAVYRKESVNVLDSDGNSVLQTYETNELVYDDEGNIKYKDNGFKYECSNRSISTDNTTLKTATDIPMENVPKGECLFEYVVYYADKYYNTYKARAKFINHEDDTYDLTTINSGISFMYDPLNPDTHQSLPAIDRVYMTVANVNVKWDSWKDEDNFTVDGYNITVEINKLESVDINKVNCQFSIGFGNVTFDYMSISNFSDSSIEYQFRVPYNPEYILDGSTYYKVVLQYKFDIEDIDEDTTGNDISETGNEIEVTESKIFSPFATYSGYLIFKRRFSELMWCNVEPVEGFSDTHYKIYRIPVIDREYYENNSEYLENKIFYQLAELDAKTINYKMLTNKINFKFAKTIGATGNLKYNDNIESIDESLKYNGWTCDLPPTISLRITVSKESKRTKNDIINDCKQTVLSFLQLKAGFETKIIRSEIARYIHDTIDDVISCEVLTPEKDILYMFTDNELPRDKDTMLSYNPEFIWIDADKIYVTVVQTPY